MERFTNPSLLVLASLAGGDKHGYAIMADVEEMTGTRMGPGTLYGVISRLEERGHIEPLPTEERRQPYRLTPAGADHLREQLNTLQNIVNTGLTRLGGEA